MSTAAIFDVGDRVTDTNPEGFAGIGIVVGVHEVPEVTGGHLYDVAYYETRPYLDLPSAYICRVVDSRLSNVEPSPETALVWHRECKSCNIVLTVSQFNENTQEPYLTIAPKDEPCGVCGQYAPGPWRPGEPERDDEFDKYDDGVADRQMQSFQGIPDEPEPWLATDAKIDRYEEEQGL